MRVLIVGAGFAGSVFARLLAESNVRYADIVVTDKRDHIGGNCYSYTHSSGIEIHCYGPHIFHTNDAEVWNFLNQWTEFNKYRHKVFAVNQDRVFSLPINLHTINQFFGHSFSPLQAQEFIKEIADGQAKNLGIKIPKNFEEKAISMIGVQLYEAFFKDYTTKQWGREPKDLPASILTRLPVRFNYDTTYFGNAKYQGIPKNGYWCIFKAMLDHPKIHVELNKSYTVYKDQKFDYIIWTGPIDEFFKYRHKRLDYRTVYWKEIVQDGDYQGTSVINYPESHFPHTRVIDFKHFTPEKNFSKSVVWFEQSGEASYADDPYYPIRDVENLKRLSLYQKDAAALKNVFFIGRLAAYQYYDMDQVIASSMASFNRFIKKI
jgi:UDP-galactopyranose mutase